MDGLQHDYGAEQVMYTETVMPNRGDTTWEQAHTYTNLHSLTHPLLNWFTLNFGYHNAHHHRPTAPWFRLPAIHELLTGNDPAWVIPLKSQLLMYHRSRVERIRERGTRTVGRSVLVRRSTRRSSRRQRRVFFGFFLDKKVDLTVHLAIS
jgi:omega-6 fatty acid desaturase (delta-12 desaturase)